MLSSLLAVLFLVLLFVGVPAATCMLIIGITDLTYIQSRLSTLTADTVVDATVIHGDTTDVCAIDPLVSLAALTDEFNALQCEYRALTTQFVNNQHSLTPDEWVELNTRLTQMRKDIYLVQPNVEA